MERQQIEALRRIVLERNPRLEPLVDTLEERDLVTPHEASELRNVVLMEIVEHDLEDGHMTAEGARLDEIVQRLQRYVDTT